MPKSDQLKAIFAPRSVAVIGASAKQHSLGRAVFANLLFAGYSGCVYPVNSKAKSVLGVRAYPTVADVPDEVDLAVVLVPAGFVPQVLKDAGRKGVKGVIVISARWCHTTNRSQLSKSPFDLSSAGTGRVPVGVSDITVSMREIPMAGIGRDGSRRRAASSSPRPSRV